MPDGVRIDRRGFLASIAAASGALTLGFRISPASPASAEINAWIVIAADDRVTIKVAKAEMGQGGFTALPMLVAEELECDWSKVTAELVAPHENLARQRAWGDMSTGGSRAIRTSHQALRTAGATAREMLIAAAAAQWSVAPAECRAANGIITHRPTGRSARFGQVAAAAATMAVPQAVALKPPSEWRLIGTRQRRLEVSDKVRGKPIYGIDVQLPGMLFAAVAQSPAFGGKLKAVDAAMLRGMRGVRKLIELDNAVAVIADNWWRAKKGLEALSVSWEGARVASSTDISRQLASGLAAPEAGAGRRDGDVALGLTGAATRIEADYAVPFLAHVTMEPQNATAHVTRDPVRGELVEVWAPTQNGEATLLAAAKAAGVPPKSVTVHCTMLGGGFGRRGLNQDFVALAVRIAKQVDQPVKVLWSREEDTRHDFYRPAAMARMSAGLDADGMPVAWRVRLAGNSILGIFRPGQVDRHSQEGFLEDMPYDIPNYLVDFAMCRTSVPVGFWRSVNHSQNCFFKECFVDEMAHAAGEDPYLYRRRLLRNHARADKLIAVLDAAADRAGWRTPARRGISRGIALNEVNGTVSAAVVEVAAGERLRISRVVNAIDCGHVVNPLTVEMQIEGATVDALAAALYGEVTLNNGTVEQSNFHDYRMLRMAQMPKIEPVILPSGGEWGGVGEPPVAVVAPALCNAVFAATGKRVRSLPLKNSDVKVA
ncbi:MAG: xanthine dehydrogenase family protein molybdopterin-binding subunit [Hyphomicrobiales bacterium]|nr:xanthine dehydrogenase family protein molybdopterin-binding subunit [Hyphomicrobiales bacterium]